MVSNNINKLKNFLSFILLTVAFSFLFYGGYRYFSCVYHVHIDFVQRHAFQNFNPKYTQNKFFDSIPNSLKQNLYQRMESCVTSISVKDYYKLTGTKFWFDTDPSNQQWSNSAKHIESICSNKLLNQIYKNKGFTEMMNFHDILITLNYEIPKTWPSKS